MLNFRERESRHGRLITISGPVKSGKKTKLKQAIRSANGRLCNLEDSVSKQILLVKHPKDRPDTPGRLTKYAALQTEDPDEMASRICDETEAMVISGVHFFEDPKIVDLVKELVVSNRLVIASGINTDYNGMPFNFMPQIMALSHDFMIRKRLPCSAKSCQLPATRSQKVNGGYERVCIKHHAYPGRPDHKHFLIDQLGSFTLDAGGMFNSKTTLAADNFHQFREMGLDCEVFKLMSDKRYGERGAEYTPGGRGIIGFNDSDEEISAVTVPDMAYVLQYLTEQQAEGRYIQAVFFDELPWFKGAFDGVRQLLYQGYIVEGTGLLRYYNMEPIEEMGKLLTIATEINVGSAYCVKCETVATESQRIDVIHGEDHIPSFYAERIKIGGDEKGKKIKTRYEARCVDHIEVTEAPASTYGFDRFEPLKR